MASLAVNKSFCAVPKYVINTRLHCLKLLKFMNECAEIDELFHESILSTKITALRGGMNVTKSTNYSYDAEGSVNTVHGCRILIKILL